MAGEGQATPTTYNDISSGKLVNKAGLLELSKNIKAYVAENAGGSSGVQQKYIVILQINSNPQFLSATTSMGSFQIPVGKRQLFTNFIDDIENGLEDKYVIYVSSDSSLANQIIPYDENYFTSHYYSLFPLEIIHCYPRNTNLNNHRLFSVIFGTNYSWTIILNFSLENEQISYYSLSGMSGGSLKTSIISGTNTIADDLRALYQRSLPTSSSTDGTYMLVDTVSSGTSTKSWETVPSGGTSLPTDPSNDGSYVLQNTISSGSSTLSWTTPSSGGTTYTAGTGISITNGVISLALANASEEAM